MSDEAEALLKDFKNDAAQCNTPEEMRELWNDYSYRLSRIDEDDLYKLPAEKLEDGRKLYSVNISVNGTDYNLFVYAKTKPKAKELAIAATDLEINTTQLYTNDIDECLGLGLDDEDMDELLDAGVFLYDSGT